jgi:NAD(P)-dependent dehydrogenase (short-subunit alcohol dehydrogenase family)
MTEQPSPRFDGKSVLITGASSGIGRATALAFAAAGARLTLAARRAAETQALVETIRAQGGEAIFVQTDVSQAEQVRHLVRTAVATYGRLDCAFNNAGVLGTPFVPTPEYQRSSWDQVIAVNLTGVFLSMQHEIPAMLASGGGAIVNMASVAGLIGGRGGIAYYASKHGVIGCTKAAAIEYATQNIRVNAVCPAVITTEMAGQLIAGKEERFLAAHPMGRFGAPEEVARVVLFLCSDAASFITGHALPVDGGLLSM